jgi:hypothetical protein
MALSAQAEEAARMRLAALYHIYNVRDYEHALNKIAYLEVLHVACKRESKAGLLPGSCYELRHYRAEDATDLDPLCQQALERGLQNLSQNKEPKYLSRACRAHYRQARAIAAYKAGKEFE